MKTLAADGFGLKGRWEESSISVDPVWDLLIKDMSYQEQLSPL